MMMMCFRLVFTVSNDIYQAQTFKQPLFACANQNYVFWNMRTFQSHLITWLNNTQLKDLYSIQIPM